MSILLKIVVISFLSYSLSVMAIPDIQHWQSDKGIPVYFIHTPELPIIDIKLIFKAASARDGEHYGLANLTNGLIAEGAAGLNGGQISEKLDEVGAQFSNGVARDMAWMQLRSLSNTTQLTPAMQVFTQILTQADFPKKAFLREQQRLLQMLRFNEQVPNSLLNDAFYQALYPKHPYGHNSEGTIATVEQLTQTQVKSFYQQYYVAANMKIAVVGALDKTKVQALIAGLEKNLNIGTEAKPLIETPPNKKYSQHISHKADQTHIMIGQSLYTRDHPDYFPLYLGNYTLGGGGLVSRLSQKIREEQGLSYSVYSHFIPMARPGPFILKLQTSTKNKTKALQLSHKILADFIKKGVTDAEVIAAKKNMIGSFALNLDSNKKLLQNLAVLAAYDMPLDYLSTWIDHIKSITPEQIRLAFQKHLDPEKMIQITVGR